MAEERQPASFWNRHGPLFTFRNTAGMALSAVGGGGLGAGFGAILDATSACSLPHRCLPAAAFLGSALGPMAFLIFLLVKHHRAVAAEEQRPLLTNR